MWYRTVQALKKVPEGFLSWGGSFIGIHYMYIIGVAIVGSILMYPINNMTYQDSLYMSVAAVTQAGLNTVDLMELKLYQQIILYILPMITTPIFIHSSVVFLRLYWFEKHFAGIKQSSKLQSKMRRAATMARSQRSDDDRIELVEDGLGHEGGLVEKEKENDMEQQNVKIVEHENSTSSGANTDPPQPTDIRFGDLPQPRRQDGVAPEDMYASISMMQRNRRMSNDDGGPALVVKGPRELENDDRTSFDTLNSDTKNSLMRSQSYNVDTASTKLDGVKFGKRAHTIEGQSSKSQLNNVKKWLHRENSLDMSKNKLQRTMSANYLSWEPTVGRNSQFVNLTPEQKEELGGVEYRALKLLAKVLVGYYVGFHCLQVVLLLPWTVRSSAYYKDYLHSVGITPVWWAVFISESGFNNCGHTLTPDSIAHFNQSAYVQLVISFFMVAGNTGFPCLLRFIIWVMFKFSSPNGRMHESLGFLLDHPRRCFTLLFPASATWWLFVVLVVLNSFDWIFYVALDIHNPLVTEGVAVGYRVLNGLFNSFATRTTGYSVTSPSALNAGMQVHYLIMMYISVLPLAISIRRTNVYEEQALGIYDSSKEANEKSRVSYVGNHLRRQLSFDLWYLAIGVFIISIAEDWKIKDTTGNFVAFDIFSIMFEVVSGYGTVGMSMGYPDSNSSFSAQFTTLSKLVVCAMMIRGRHRGLPYALDRAVMKPRLQDTANNDQQSAPEDYQDDHQKPKASSLLGTGFGHLRRLSRAGLAPGPPKKHL